MGASPHTAYHLGASGSDSLAPYANGGVAYLLVFNDYCHVCPTQRGAFPRLNGRAITASTARHAPHVRQQTQRARFSAKRARPSRHFFVLVSGTARPRPSPRGACEDVPSFIEGMCTVSDRSCRRRFLARIQAIPRAK